MLITPRSWEKFSDIIKQNSQIDIKEVSLNIANEIIGPAAVHFIKYLEEKNIINPADVINQYSKVSDKLKLLSREQVYALNAELVNYISSLKRINKKHLSNFYKYANEILEEDIKVSILQSLARQTEKQEHNNDFVGKYLAEYEDEAESIIEIFTRGIQQEEPENQKEPKVQKEK